MKVIVSIILFQIVLWGYTIDFKNALTQTIQNNKSLKAKQKNIQKAKLSLEEAKGYDYGELVLSENISRTNHPGYVFGMKSASGEVTFRDFGFDYFIDNMSGLMNPATYNQTRSDLLAHQPEELNNPESRTNYETKATYKLPLFTGYKLDNAQKMAKLQVLAQKALYSFDEKKLTLEVLKAYNGAVAAKEFIKATQKAKKATSSYVNFASELFKEGLVTSIDVKQAQVYDMGVESKMVEAQNRYDLSLSYLKFLTANSDITDIESFYIVQTKLAKLDSLQNKGLNNREDIRWMELNTKTLQSKIDFESSVKYPTIGAQVEYGYNDNSLNNIDSDHDYYMAAVGISYTLFDGGISSSKIQSAKIEHKQALDYFEYMKDGIKLEIEKNYLNVQAKQKIYTQKKKARTLAQEVLEQSRQMYQNQLINMSELLRQQANEQKANAEAIMAKYELNLAEAILKISLGEEL
jgi:outer membrane protein TolC